MPEQRGRGAQGRNPQLDVDYKPYALRLLNDMRDNGVAGRWAELPQAVRDALPAEPMQARCGAQPGSNTDFQAMLNALKHVKPSDVVRLLNFHAFGKHDPEPNDLPTRGRYETLANMKRSISYYFANYLGRHMPYDENIVENEGPYWAQMNPVRHADVNAVYQRVKRMQSQGKGKQSQARREMTFDEVLKVFEVLETKDDDDLQLTVLERRALGALFRLEWHLVGRCDDMASANWSCFDVDLSFSYLMNVTLKKTKTAPTDGRQLGTRERSVAVVRRLTVNLAQRPTQFMLASTSPAVCVHLHMALYLATLLDQATNHFQDLNAIDEETKGSLFWQEYTAASRVAYSTKTCAGH